MAKCSSTKTNGDPCRANALKGTSHCLAHSDSDTRASVGFVAEAGNLGGRPRRPREIELVQEVADEFKDELRRVLVEGLTAESPVVVGGNSRDARVEMVPDARQQLATFREIMDRLHGRPRQVSELSGPDGGPVVVASVFDLERLSLEEKRSLLELLEKAGER